MTLKEYIYIYIYISGQWNATLLRLDTPLSAQRAFVRGDFMVDRTIVHMVS